MNDSYFDPPEDPDISPEAEAIAEKLEAAGVEQALIDEITSLIETLQLQANPECRVCNQRVAEAEIAADNEPFDWRQASEETSLCHHNLQIPECNACVAESDLAYDIDRENRHCGR